MRREEEEHCHSGRQSCEHADGEGRACLFPPSRRGLHERPRAAVEEPFGVGRCVLIVGGHHPVSARLFNGCSKATRLTSSSQFPRRTPFSASWWSSCVRVNDLCTRCEMLSGTLSPEWPEALSSPSVRAFLFLNPLPLIGSNSTGLAADAGSSVAARMCSFQSLSGALSHCFAAAHTFR
jgi:hypothetical protein